MTTAPRTGAPAGWTDAGQAARLVCRPHHLRRTALTALIVGTVLFVINHLDTVLAGAATTTTWVKIAITYLVPFTVANIGLLLGTRHRPDRDIRGRARAPARGRTPPMTDSRSPAHPVVVFDVNETLSDMTPMTARFTDLGAPAPLARLWFTTVLRDGFARTAAGASERFAVLAAGALRTVLHGVEINRDLDAAVEHVLAGFAQLPVHPDVPDGIRVLHSAGFPLVTLSNGSADVADQLLRRAGLREAFDRLLTVDDAGAWKPAPLAYHHAATTCAVRPADMVLVAVHPWDIDGAARAGLRTAWLNRTATPYPDYCTTPEHTITTLPELAAALR